MKDIIDCLIELRALSKPFNLIPCDSVDSAGKFLSRQKLTLSPNLLSHFLLSSKFDFLNFWSGHQCLIQTNQQVFLDVFSKGSVEAFDFLVRMGVNFSDTMVGICFFKCCQLSRFDILASIIKLDFFTNFEPPFDQKSLFIYDQVPRILTREKLHKALDWWKKTFSPQPSDKYFSLVFEQIVTIDSVCLDWWQGSDLVLYHYRTDRQFVPYFGSELNSEDFEKIRWCINKRLQFKLEVPIQVPENGIQTSHSTLYCNNGLFPEVTEKQLNSLCDKGKIGELGWILQNSSYARKGGIILRHSVKAVDVASSLGHLHILNLWKEAHEKWEVPFRYSPSAFILAARNCRLQSLNWWLESNFAIKLKPEHKELCLEVFSGKEEDRKKIENWLGEVAEKYFKVLRSCEQLEFLPDELLIGICSFL